MRLVRNTQTNGTCKYAVLRLDKMRKDSTFRSIPDFIDKYPELEKYVEFGEPHSREEFFVIKFKDLASTAALRAYAEEVKQIGDEELSIDILSLLERTGKNHPKCKMPDTDINSYLKETNTTTSDDISINSTDSNKITEALLSGIDALVSNGNLDDDIGNKLKKIYSNKQPPPQKTEGNFIDQFCTHIN